MYWNVDDAELPDYNPLEEDEDSGYTFCDSVMDSEELCKCCPRYTKTYNHWHGCDHLNCLDIWLKYGGTLEQYLESSLYKNGTTGFNIRVNLPRINPDEFKERKDND